MTKDSANRMIDYSISRANALMDLWIKDGEDEVIKQIKGETKMCVIYLCNLMNDIERDDFVSAYEKSFK